ncbi:MAG: hypothetical protein OEQ13_10740 [Acidobacteriota bacterium]|nr:hypothetical protein [Acidobacteriota bacterium]
MTRAPRDNAPRASHFWVGTVAGIALGAVLLFSAYAKALDPKGFAAQIARDGMLDASLATPAALVVIALEAALGLALVLGLRHPLVLSLATAMMIAFVGLAAWQWAYPPADPSTCGCFGNFVEQTPAEHTGMNGLFVLLALAAWLGRPLFASRRWWLAVRLAGCAGAMGFSAAAPALPIDDWPGATRLKPGISVADLRVDEIVPELQDDTHLVLLIDRADEETRLDIARVNEHLALVGGPVNVFGLAEENEELEAQFFWTAAPAFDVRGAPYGLIKPLYRSLPRAFVVRDGVVVEVWNGIPGDEQLVALAEGRLP